ncbi:transposase [Streptomyces adustus]|uniref:Transposase n=1 Tax=Streptomyces adustus TaxID=1609272 RepID=A0A5N8VLE5_9ACTN|nr:transposase [Streptomyces adustus]
MRTRYSTDLSDPECEILCPLVPAVKPGGRPAKHTRREILNALAYWLRAGCAWRLLPHDLPPWQTVYRGTDFHAWVQEATGITVEVVQRRDGGFRSTWVKEGAPPPAAPVFAVVPRRWVVERTFAWLGRCRRLSKDYEYLRVCSGNAIYLTMAMLLVRRLARSAR